MQLGGIRSEEAIGHQRANLHTETQLAALAQVDDAAAANDNVLPSLSPV